MLVQPEEFCLIPFSRVRHLESCTLIFKCTSLLNKVMKCPSRVVKYVPQCCFSRVLALHGNVLQRIILKVTHFHVTVITTVFNVQPLCLIIKLTADKNLDFFSLKLDCKQMVASPLGNYVLPATLLSPQRSYFLAMEVQLCIGRLLGIVGLLKVHMKIQPSFHHKHLLQFNLKVTSSCKFCLSFLDRPLLYQRWDSSS